MGILFPPTQISKEVSTEVYAAVIKQFGDYSSLNLLPQGGAHIQRPDGSFLHFEPDKVQVNDMCDDVAFAHAKERIVALVEAVLSRVKPQVYLVTGIGFISHLKTEKADGGRAFTISFLKPGLTPAKIEEALGQKLGGIGLRFNMTKERAEFDLRVEPFLREPSTLWVQIDAQFPGPENDALKSLEKRIDQVAGFLKSDVKDFLSEAGGGAE